MSPARPLLVGWLWTVNLGCAARLRMSKGIMTSGSSLGVTLWDLFFVGLTIVVFAVLLLILKGIETFER
jgi:hypothetical protein